MSAKNILLFFVLLFLSYSLAKGVFIYTDRFKIYKQLKERKQNLEKEKIELQTRLKKAKSIDFIEKTIRNKLQLAKPNETIVIMSYPTPTPTPKPKQPVPVWKQWVDLFR